MGQYAHSVCCLAACHSWFNVEESHQQRNHDRSHSENTGLPPSGWIPILSTCHGLQDSGLRRTKSRLPSPVRKFQLLQQQHRRPTHDGTLSLSLASTSGEYSSFLLCVTTKRIYCIWLASRTIRAAGRLILTSILSEAHFLICYILAIFLSILCYLGRRFSSIIYTPQSEQRSEHTFTCGISHYFFHI